MRRSITTIVACLVLLAACSGSSGDRPFPTVSLDEVNEVQATATNYQSIYYDAWPNIRSATDRWADDIVSHDPTNDEWVLEGADTLVDLYLYAFAPSFPNVEWVVADTYLGTNGFVYHVSSDMWPPWVPESDDPETRELDWWQFEGDNITSMSFWFAEETAEAIGEGCVGSNTCDPDLQTIVDGYIDAWASGDPDQIAALYASDAAFTDSMFGIHASGPDDIASQADARFGAAPHTVRPGPIYVQTDGFTGGAIFGVAIMYTVTDADGHDILHSVTLFDLGTLEPDGDVGSATLHPDGLIVREDVFHLQSDLASLTS